MLRLTLAALHLLALGIGLGGIWGRARELAQRPLEMSGMRRAFAADSWWGIAALLWLVTGLWRLFAGTEKATSYYTRDESTKRSPGASASSATSRPPCSWRWSSPPCRWRGDTGIVPPRSPEPRH
ncbi:MAG TPA: DUF2214 family protein [Gemmatimonadaceae bacterium]|nr:DUF2214 family protein [Gemmatimonadaceae bacterium]